MNKVESKRMDNQAILTKAITQAIAGGWEHGWGHVDNLRKDGANHYINQDKVEKLIYNHDFAKALWGDLPGTIARHVDENGQQRDGQVILEWQFHLQQMVIADDPVQYLGANL